MAEPEPMVIRALNEWRARVQAQEAATMRELTRQWMGVENALRADMLELATYLDELQNQGETITAARLMQMERYQKLIADARAEQARYSQQAAAKLAEGQRQGLADIGSAGTVFTLYKDPAGTAWTNSGNKQAGFTLTYEIA